MFDSISSERSPAFRIVFRAVFSLSAGAILTFVLPWVFLTIEGYVPNGHRNSFVTLVLIVFNLPALIYCTLFTMPDALPESDLGLYCWAVGFYFNTPYYALVIFLLSSWYQRRRNRKLQLETHR